MDFSPDWVKPVPVMATEPLVKARLELAQTATPRPEPDSQQSPPSLQPPA
jgi:hypothetical protein